MFDSLQHRFRGLDISDQTCNREYVYGVDILVLLHAFRISTFFRMSLLLLSHSSW
jgi:hypothetical protein